MKHIITAATMVAASLIAIPAAAQRRGALPQHSPAQMAQHRARQLADSLQLDSATTVRFVVAYQKVQTAMRTRRTESGLRRGPRPDSAQAAPRQLPDSASMAARAKQRDALMLEQLKAHDAEYAGILTPEQIDRLHQLQLRQMQKHPRMPRRGQAFPGMEREDD